MFNAPSAQFRIIHSRDIYKTYPLPPFSTIIGLLANVLGHQENINKFIAEQFALGVSCSYEYKSQEYIWLRNLNANQHRKRFHHNRLREWQGMVDHPGFQSPKNIEVLNDVELFIYLSHPNEVVLNTLVKNIEKPERWLSHIHLGRSEDWACIEDVSFKTLSISNKPENFQNASRYHQWMPRPDAAFGVNEYLSFKEYEALYNKIQGNIALVTSIYKLVEAPYSEGEGRYIRNFNHIPAKIINNPVPFLDDFTLPNLFVDQELKIPVYMTQINKGGEDN